MPDVALRNNKTMLDYFPYLIGELIVVGWLDQPYAGTDILQMRRTIDAVFWAVVTNQPTDADGSW